MDNDNSSASSFEVNRKGNQKYNIKYPIMFLGNSGVGKTCICYKESQKKFFNEYSETESYENFNIDIKYKDVNIQLDILDTSGNEKNNSLIKALLKDILLVIVVYSIDE